MGRNFKYLYDIDALIGARISAARKQSSISVNMLAGNIGVSHQQLRKYENGSNRISIGRLMYIAKILEKPIRYFLEGLDSEVKKISEE